MERVAINTLIFGASTFIELYANFIKSSQTMTLEEANAAWSVVQEQVKVEHDLWDKMVDEIQSEGGS